LEKTGIVIVTLELSPFFKVTGVGDLLRNIVAELARRQIAVTVICPDCGCEYPNLTFQKSLSFYSSIGGHASPMQFRCAADEQGVTYFLLKNKELEQYLKRLPAEPTSAETAKICLEFCYGTYLVLEALSKGQFGLAGKERLVVHAFHWQTGPLLGLIKQTRWPQQFNTVLTVDILDKQGRFNPEVFEAHEIFHALRGRDGEEINFLQTGIEHADVLHTVSPNYAREIQQAPYGRGLEGLLNQRHQEGRLLGILNGLDPVLSDWQCIPILQENVLCIAPDNEQVLEHKTRAKLLFQKAAGLPADPEAFLITMGHRFVTQKNFALVANAMDKLMALTPRPQIYLRAWPEPGREEPDQELWWQITRFSKRYRFHVAFLSPFDRDQSLIDEGIFIDRFLYYAASDLFLMPSLWEPCGLCQLEAMRFGAIPVVTAVGGLVDTVKPLTGENQGWGFRLEDPFDPQGLVDAVQKAIHIKATQPELWLGMVRRAMAFDSSIAHTVDAYLDQLYTPNLPSFPPSQV
jgi:starch synthase